MTNKEIAATFDELANIMELHDENKFKIRSYQNAYLTIRKLDRPLASMNAGEIASIPGVGAAISSKIQELISRGSMKTLDEYRAKTPAGVVEMLRIGGFGPKKVQLVWREMGIESTGELWYACNENRLIEVKGFGKKTQEDIRQKLEYFFKSRDKMHLDAAIEEADFITTFLSSKLPDAAVAAVGEVRRRCPVVGSLEILVGFDGDLHPVFGEVLKLEKQEGSRFFIRLENDTQAILTQCGRGEFGSKLFKASSSKEFLEAFVKKNEGVDFKNLPDERQIFEKIGWQFVPPELRESAATVEQAAAGNLPEIVENQHIRGVLHVHTTYSDGIHSLREMCLHAKNLGYEYIGITDHSQSAFYANGLKIERLAQQWEEIEKLNLELAPFRIFKGIESDILNDGNLDYPDEVLEKFDFVIASVHSNLRMPIEKATERVVRAIENRHTTILGHPTGRLLLSREGYPLDWDRVLEACARCRVAIELNANPHRLDMDWTLIPAARKLGIPIAIDPDAHSREGISDINFGVMVARKGGLSADGCLNFLSAEEFSRLKK